MDNTHQTLDVYKSSIGNSFLTSSNEKSPVSSLNPKIDHGSKYISQKDDVIPEVVHTEEFPESSYVEMTKQEETTVPKMNNIQTLMHLFKSNIGTGILALPIAVKNAGIWTGTVGILFVGAVAVHCMHMLMNCGDILCKRTGNVTLDYAGVMEACLKTGPPAGHRFSKYARPFVDALLIFTLLGACCVYIVFVATNIQMVAEYYTLNIRIYELAVALVLLPFVCIRNLKYLAPFSAFANVLTLIGLIIIIQYIVQGLPKTSTLPAFSSITDIPLFLGTAIFTMEGIGLVLPLRNSMKRPQDFGGWFGLLNVGMTSIICLYSAVGFYGYLKFGDNIESSITLSLPEETLYVSVRVIFAVSILITYNIQLYVPISLLWPRILRHIHREVFRKYGEFVFRIGVVILTYGFAAAVPHLDLLISLIGSFAGSFLALILPATIEVVTLMSEDKPLPKYIVVKDFLIFLFGIFGTCIGTYISIKAIIETY